MNTVIKQTEHQNTLKRRERKVFCKKCKSSQIVANKRGYSFSNMFITILITFAICIFLAILFPSLDNVAVSANLNIIGLILFYIGIPVSIIRGFYGRNDIVNGCMNCGNKWIAGKR
ncbi:hypothetical protein [Lederbergia graminis]|uniref:Uncharacterized protein n=1 Tax=Lederbergia graminis TaxID=735518 RepID=A0ABW0LKL1_9BACI